MSEAATMLLAALDGDLVQSGLHVTTTYQLETAKGDEHEVQRLCEIGKKTALPLIQVGLVNRLGEKATVEVVEATSNAIIADERLYRFFVTVGVRSRDNPESVDPWIERELDVFLSKLTTAFTALK
ncbi:hypothetical protein DFH06DRAFT_1320134 [Mycena polygramma]|nr:hypothetical protein DFH06DRAFT_1320134 [Mycena polygramma]